MFISCWRFDEKGKLSVNSRGANTLKYYFPTAIITYLDSKFPDVFEKIEYSLKSFEVEITNLVVSTASSSYSCSKNISTYSKVLRSKPTVTIKQVTVCPNHTVSEFRKCIFCSLIPLS